MASHGSSKHQKRMAAPKASRVARKTHVWLQKPNAGPHAKDHSLALGTLLVEQLKICETQRLAKKLVTKGKVLVDGRNVADVKFPMGLMDILSIPALQKHYVMLIQGGQLVPVEISDQQAKTKLCRVMDKTVLPGGRIQLHLHDGRNLLIVREEDRFKTGDTVKVAVPKQTLQGFLKLEKGATCYIHQGRHSGQTAKLDGIVDREGSRRAEANLSADGHNLITLKDYLFVVEPGFNVK